jgi:uncharacterized RDD family membrane protein YckC
MDQLVWQGLLFVAGFGLLVQGIVGLVVMAFSPRHQRVGDLVARTLVVRISADAA